MKECLININDRGLQVEHVKDIEEEAKMNEVKLLEKSLVKQIIYYLLCFCSLGIVYLFTRWFTNLQVKLIFTTYNKKEKKKLYIQVKNVDN